MHSKVSTHPPLVQQYTTVGIMSINSYRTFCNVGLFGCPFIILFVCWFCFSPEQLKFCYSKKKVLCRHRQLQRIALAGEVICILYLCFYDFITGNPRYTFDCSSSFADRLREQGKLFECGVDNLCIDASKDVCDSTVNCDNFIDESDCDDEWLGRCYYYNIRHAAIWNPYRNHEHGFKCSQWTDTCIRTTIGYKYYIVGLHLCHTYLFTF